MASSTIDGSLQVNGNATFLGSNSVGVNSNVTIAGSASIQGEFTFTQGSNEINVGGNLVLDEYATVTVIVTATGFV